MTITKCCSHHSKFYANNLLLHFFLLFKTQTMHRLLSTGDVISLSTREFPEFTQEAVEGGGQRLPSIYFLVNKIVSPVEGALSYLVNVLHTTVYQVCACL